MPNIKPTYEEVKEFNEKANKLVQKYPDLYSHVDADAVKCLAINNKDRSEKGRLWEIKAIPEYALPDCAFSYYVIIFLKDWVEMPEKIKNRMVAAIMYAIPDEEGKIRTFDLRDFGPMVRTFGVDYLENEDGQDPVEDDVRWIV